MFPKIATAMAPAISRAVPARPAAVPLAYCRQYIALIVLKEDLTYMSFWSTMPKPTSTKQLSMTSEVVMDTMQVRMAALTGLSIVVVDKAPTQEVWSATKKMICHRW